MMEAVKRGGNRQELHEIIRGCTMKATQRMKNGEKGGLLELLAAEPKLGLKDGEINDILEPSKYIGRCPQQVEKYLAKLAPVIAEATGDKVEINI
jgi:adenylosuccinate lyase